MKVIIELDFTVFKDEYAEHKSFPEVHRILYKPDGWLLDEESEAIYYEADIPFMPHEGQFLITKIGYSKVTFSIYKVEDSGMTGFFDSSRIIITEGLD